MAPDPIIIVCGVLQQVEWQISTSIYTHESIV